MHQQAWLPSMSHIRKVAAVMFMHEQALLLFVVKQLTLDFVVHWKFTAPFTRSLNSETSGDNKTTLLHCGDVSAHAIYNTTQVSALRVDVQRLSQGKRSAEARALAAETAAQQCQQEVAAMRVLTASMLAQPHTGPFQDLEGTESAKPGFTGEGSNSVVDTLTQQQGSRVRWLATPEAVRVQQDLANTMQCQCQRLFVASMCELSDVICMLLLLLGAFSVGWH